MINNLTVKNQKIRHRSQLFSELTHDMYKLNEKYQNLDIGFVVKSEENNDI